MLEIRRSQERGHADHGWLDSHHTFSFADYYDPANMGFRGLRVINEDRVAPGKGFGTHGHRDMEIVSYVLSGSLEHKDSMGTGSVLRPGDVQRMSAGTGVRHSEFNGSASDPVHFLQIWLLPRRAGIAPSYEERHFAEETKRGQLRLVAAGDGEAGSLALNADARIFAGLFDANEGASHVALPGRHTFVHVARGTVSVDGTRLEAGDAAFTSESGTLRIEGVEHGEVLLFDLT